MDKKLWVLIVFIISLSSQYASAYAVDQGWNVYSCSKYGLEFKYPNFLNHVEVDHPGWESVKLSDGSMPEYAKLWTVRNKRHIVHLSIDSTRHDNCLVATVHSNPDGYDLQRCATEFATFNLDKVTDRGYWVKHDTLSIGEATVLHVKSGWWSSTDGSELKYVNAYVMQSRCGNIVTLSIDETCMKSMLTEEYGDYIVVVTKIIGSIPQIR